MGLQLRSLCFAEDSSQVSVLCTLDLGARPSCGHQTKLSTGGTPLKNAVVPPGKEGVVKEEPGMSKDEGERPEG